MNKKNPRDAKGLPITIRLTEKENKMAKELRSRFNINISSLVRNSIVELYGKMNHE